MIWKSIVSLSLGLVVCALMGCADEKIPVSIVGYNHTDKYIHSFTVNGGGGSNAFAHSGGGSFVCCVLVPPKWRPELKAQIRWMNEDDSWNETIVAIPEYAPKDISGFNVHFLKNGLVMVFVSGKSIDHVAYPLKGEQAKL
jgi:hypothetical protein